MLIQIDGWFGSGKSVLWMLLDGHPEVFCTPFHDFSQCAFLTEDDERDWVTTKHIEILRKALSRTQYYMFEKLHWDKYYTFPFSAQVQIKLLYDLDFYKADKALMTTLMGWKSWKIEPIVDELYKSIMTNSNSVANPMKAFRYASMAHPYYVEHYEKMPTLLPSSKSIQVRRTVEEIIAARSNRRPIPEDFKTKSFYSDTFKTRLAGGEVEKILSYYDQYDFLIQKYPQQFMKIDFNDLVLRTESSMIAIAEFIGLAVTRELFVGSYNGKEIEYNGQKYIGQKNDSVEDLLTRDERAIVAERISNYYAGRK